MSLEHLTGGLLRQSWERWMKHTRVMDVEATLIVTRPERRSVPNIREDCDVLAMTTHGYSTDKDITRNDQKP